MTKESRYSKKQHELAFRLYRSGQSFREISESEGMPSYEYIRQWSLPDFNCDCEFHGWKEKQREIMDEALEEVDKDLPDPVERDKERLRNLYKIEQELFAALRAGELERPTTLKGGVEILAKALDMSRLTRGESTEITEQRGGQTQHLNISEILNQLNIGEDVTEDEVIDAAEEEVMHGEE